SFLKNLKLVAKSFKPSWRDNQISASFVIIYFNPLCGPSLCYPWRRLSLTNQGGRFARERQIKETVRMRLKLVFLTSFLAAVVGAGSCIALVLGVFSRQALSSPGLLVLSTFLLPLATIVFASVFVYRHTAKRRRLQAFLTVSWPHC